MEVTKREKTADRQPKPMTINCYGDHWRWNEHATPRL